jgi:hypothetical protein
MEFDENDMLLVIGRLTMENTVLQHIVNLQREKIEQLEGREDDGKVSDITHRS